MSDGTFTSTGEQMKRVMAVGVFDLLHAGHLHYMEQAKSLGQHLTVVVAHDDTVRMRKHEPVTGQELRRRMVGQQTLCWRGVNHWSCPQ